MNSRTASILLAHPKRCSRYGPLDYSPPLAAALEGLGRYLGKVGRFAEMVVVYEELRDMYRDYLPPASPVSLRSLLRLSHLYYALKRHKEATLMYQQVGWYRYYPLLSPLVSPLS